VSWTPAPEELNVSGESPAVPGKSEGSGRAPRDCPLLPATRTGEGRPGARTLGESPELRILPATTRRFGEPTGRPEFDFLGLWGEGDVRGLPGLAELLSGSREAVAQPGRWRTRRDGSGGCARLGTEGDGGPRSAACRGAWPRLGSRLPRGRRRLPPTAKGRGGCVPGVGTGD
jgi:hypothetical protein